MIIGLCRRPAADIVSTTVNLSLEKPVVETATSLASIGSYVVLWAMSKYMGTLSTFRMLRNSTSENQRKTMLVRHQTITEIQDW